MVKKTAKVKVPVVENTASAIEDKHKGLTPTQLARVLSDEKNG